MHASSAPDPDPGAPRRSSSCCSEQRHPGRSSSCCPEQRIETLRLLLAAVHRRRQNQRAWLVWSPTGWLVL